MVICAFVRLHRYAEAVDNSLTRLGEMLKKPGYRPIEEAVIDGGVIGRMRPGGAEVDG